MTSSQWVLSLGSAGALAQLVMIATSTLPLGVNSFVLHAGRPSQPIRSPTQPSLFGGTDHVKIRKRGSPLDNVYDDWRSDAVVDTMYLSEEHIEACLEELVESDYGMQMFGVHDRPASVGITGEIRFVEIQGPEVVLSLSGKFWHRRDTVLGRAAMWLNARMPEIVTVTVEDPEDLLDASDVLDEFGEVLYQEDKRADDFNGDREVMEYQGIDPDIRGPFPQGVGGGGSMINPA